MSTLPSSTGSSKVRRTFPVKIRIKFRLPGRSHYRSRRRRLPRWQTGEEEIADHVYTPFWRSVEYSGTIPDLPDGIILTPKMHITNQRWKDCNILTDYLLPLYLIDTEYYPNIQPTESLQAFTEHYPHGTNPYIIYLPSECSLPREGIQEANDSTEGFFRILDEEYRDGDFKWHISVAQEILSWLLIPNWCCICCDKNAEGIYRAARLLRLEALVNLLEETPYGPILKSDDHHDQTLLTPPYTNDGRLLHSLAVPWKTESFQRTCFFWSTNLYYRDLRRFRQGMHLVDQTFFALEVMNEWPYETPFGRLCSSRNNAYDGDVDLSTRFQNSRGETLGVHTPLNVQRLGITMWSFLDCITRITRNAHRLSQSGNFINPDESIGKYQYQRPRDASANENFLSEPPCFGIQIVDPLEEFVEEAAGIVKCEEPTDDLFSFSFARNRRPSYFFDSYVKQPHVLITGNARTLELFLREYSSLVGNYVEIIAALRIRNPSPEIYDAVVKSVKVVGYNSLLQSLYIVEERVFHMMNLLSLFQNLSPVLRIHSILETKVSRVLQTHSILEIMEVASPVED